MPSPAFKIFTAAKEYTASCKTADLAVRIVALLGPGAFVKWAHAAIVYTHGKDGDASESIDGAALALQRNVQAFQQACWDKQQAAIQRAEERARLQLAPTPSPLPSGA